eukprot:1572818-Amphidinium_carterae.1
MDRVVEQLRGNEVDWCFPPVGVPPKPGGSLPEELLVCHPCDLVFELTSHNLNESMLMHKHVSKQIVK